MNKDDSPLLLDLYCGGGGAAVGYNRVGFRIFGVDIKRQRHFPFPMVTGDIREVWDLLPHDRVAVYHASPPCKIHTKLSRLVAPKHRDKYEDLVGYTRELLISTGKPYIIENVIGAPLIDPIMLCGTMFQLETKHGCQLIRHRLFETYPKITTEPPPCNHKNKGSIGVYGGGQLPSYISVAGNPGGVETTGKASGFSVDDRRDAMGIDWLPNAPLTQAIPPAYTSWIGTEFFKLL